MASVIRGKGELWEIRESVRKDGRPHSRTLATFKRLDHAAIAHARARSSSALVEEALIAAARRAGAPVAPRPGDAAATALLRELSAGRPPRSALRRLLAAQLEGEASPSDASRSAAEWIGSTAHEHGEALRDLLLLADALPPPKRRRELRYPPLIARPG